VWLGRRVVLGVAGGVAAYKCVLLARELARAGAEVDVVMTRGAAEFVGPVTFEAVTHRPVRTSLWERGAALEHLTVPGDADLIIIAPATANLLARAAAGIADDLLTTMLVAATAPVVFAPAMNDEMYANAATQANLAALAGRGWHAVGPGVGDLAEGPSTRPGRMAEPDEILAHAARAISGPSRLAGRRALITAGATREPIDRVRFVSNRSSGKMGYRLAEAAWRRGANVTLISGPSGEPAPHGVTVVRVETTGEMAAAVKLALPGTDLLVMAAAPADFRPTAPRTGKLPRSEGAFTLELAPTDDILLATVADRPSDMIAVGFALESGNAVEKGRAKLDRKQLDLIVVNDADEAGAGFDVDTNRVTILDRRGRVEQVPLQAKAQVAEAILDAVERYRE
jgi:phosphopantothenoylcysteine decarboxylase/phosphopantothenate--cysteine ligase